MKELLKKLTETDGVSGFEGPVKEIMREELEERADEVEEDSLGNLIAKKGEGEPTLMVTAHLDQIGLTVNHINEEGFIGFSELGGVDDRILLSQRIKIRTTDETVRGVISTKPPHLSDEEEKKKPPEKEKLFIDVGASDKEDAEENMGIEVGDPISFDQTFTELGEENIVTASAFDDRVGCLVLLKLLEKFDSNFTLYAVATVQEDVGLKGARTVAYKINPDVAVSIDVEAAGDVPGVEDRESTTKIGGGPALSLIEAEGRGLIVTPSVRNWLEDTAKENEISYQKSVVKGGMSEGAITYITREGIPAGSVGIPTRNVHSSVEVLDLEDVEKAVEWLSESFNTFKDYFE